PAGRPPAPPTRAPNLVCPLRTRLRLSQRALRRTGRRAFQRAGLAQRAAERLERRFGDVVVVLAGGLDVERQPCLDREPLERVRQEGDRELADAVAAEGERYLGVR